MEVQLVLLILLEIIFLENSLNQSVIFKRSSWELFGL